MDEKERGNIALILWRSYIVRNGLPGQTMNGLKREIGNYAKATGIPKEKLQTWLSCLLHDIANEIVADINPRFTGPRRDHRDN
jgi:hypothetical protein